MYTYNKSIVKDYIINQNNRTSNRTLRRIRVRGVDHTGCETTLNGKTIPRPNLMVDTFWKDKDGNKSQTLMNLSYPHYKEFERKNRKSKLNKLIKLCKRNGRL